MISPTARIPSPRWIKLKDAAVYSSIGRKRLTELARAGAVVGFQDTGSDRRDWIFDRNSLDAYRLSQYTERNLEDEALRNLTRT